jgi:hypothetical protein
VDLTTYFKVNFSRYKALAPSVGKIHSLLLDGKKSVKNDHIALRTIDLTHTNKEKCAKFFIEHGYQKSGEYSFEEKKLNAIHLEKAGWPKVFISELILKNFSEELQNTCKEVFNSIPVGLTSIELLHYGRKWNFSHSTYTKVVKESPYAAWCLAIGFCPNHFTIDLNTLDSFSSLEQLNEHLKKEGFLLNQVEGEIKGSPSVLLEQSSTLADRKMISFEEGDFEVPTCYYEFAKRYKGQDGKYFQGFIAQSADKIFESTNSQVKS